uniref:DUF4968 domain-containing protein n=1 Tax=Ascaris lumbricoides TaxID=6252 RepID=A0A0M3HYP5_ASCLU
MARPTEIVFPRTNQRSSRRLILRNKTGSDFALKSPQLVQVYCRPANPRTEAICCRWFKAPVENTKQMQQQLAQTLTVTFSDGYVASDTILDLPGNSLAVQSERYPTFCADDSDTRTAWPIDCDTEAAWGISDKEMKSLLSGDVKVVAERCVEDGVDIMMSHNATSGFTAACDWMTGVVARIFQQEEGHDSVSPCGVGI